MFVLNDLCFSSFLLVSLIRKKAAGLESAASIRTKVFVWGLNDKDQLGGLKGSKVRPRLKSRCHLSPRA